MTPAEIVRNWLDEFEATGRRTHFVPEPDERSIRIVLAIFAISSTWRNYGTGWTVELLGDPATAAAARRKELERPKFNPRGRWLKFKKPH